MTEAPKIENNTPLPDEAAVRAFFAANPSFFKDHPDLLNSLELPARHDGRAVVDMQSVMIDRLRADHDKLKRERQTIINNSAVNATLVARMVKATLLALEAGNLADLTATMTHAWPDLMDVDVVSLGVESPTGAPSTAMANGVYMLEPGVIDRMIGSADKAILLSDTPQARETLYGPATPLVKSDALVRLRPANNVPQAVLAFGSRQDGFFHQGQATDVIAFLGGVVERLLGRWISQS
ncbi:MAG: DUF484 family protein [Alphaproteobacteria bacterium]